MSQQTLSSIAEVLHLCCGETVSSVVLDLDTGCVRLLCGDTVVTVAVDQMGELYRRGVFPAFIVDYLRTNRIL